MNAKEKTVALMVTNTGVNLALTAGEEAVLYTVPTGYTFVPTMVVLRAFSKDEHGTPPIFTFGIGGGDCDEFLGDQTLNTITANFASECLMLRPIQAASPVTGDVIPAGSTFSMESTQANGEAMTCTADVFGYLF